MTYLFPYPPFSAVLKHVLCLRSRVPLARGDGPRKPRASRPFLVDDAGDAIDRSLPRTLRRDGWWLET